MALQPSPPPKVKTTSTVEIIQVTPVLARQWLDNRMECQRKVRPTHVHRLAADMRAGRFHLSPDCIVIIKGYLANGQHRLEAVIESGKTILMLVLTSEDETLYTVIDSGIPRTVGDTLIGLPYCNKMASVARWVIAYEDRTITTADGGLSLKGASENGEAWTRSMLVNFCQEHGATLGGALEFAWPLYNQTKIIPLTTAAAFHVLAERQGNCVAKMREFLQFFFLGGGPALVDRLRNRLIEEKGKRSRLSRGYTFLLVLKTFVAFRDGRSMGVLKFNPGEAIPEL